VKRYALIALAPLVALIAEGGAYAYWQATGQGTAVVHAANPAAPTYTGHVTNLLPGGSSDVVLSVTNPNAFALSVVGARAEGRITDTTGGDPDCASHVAFAYPAGGTPIVVPGDNVPHDVVLPGAVTMDTSTPGECQGAGFTLTVTLVLTA
jgi:hypothetical protein